MKYDSISSGAPRQKRRRVGRGIAAGQGKTAGRGTKGQRSRAGSSRRPGFEGGQNPLMQRLPKLRGFTSSRKQVTNVFTDSLAGLGTQNIDSNVLAEKGLIKNPHLYVKLLLRGKLTTKLVVSLPSSSKTAVEALQKAGGSFKKTPQLKRQKLPRSA